MWGEEQDTVLIYWQIPGRDMGEVPSEASKDNISHTFMGFFPGQTRILIPNVTYRYRLAGWQRLSAKMMAS
jgi:hypothetical protein